MHKIRAEITKGEAIRYISHLDYASALERAIRRANLPAAYSEGFNPHMKLSFASALAVGATSGAEYMDVEFTERVAADSFAERLSARLPGGIALARAKEIEGKSPSLMSLVDSASYELRFPGTEPNAVSAALEAFGRAERLTFTRVAPKAKKEIEVKQYVESPIEKSQDGQALVLRMKLRITPAGSVKPGEIVSILNDSFAAGLDENSMLIHRTGLFAAGKTPMEL